MTVPDLIAQILTQLQNQFYCDRPRREYLVDEKYLVAAIGTYGYECNQRGWEFDTAFIYRELSQILTSFKHAGTDVKWMPNYLQQSIRRHIGEHAEELNAQAKAIRAVMKRTLAAIQPVHVREPAHVEVLGSVYRDVKRLRRQSQAASRLQSAEERKQKTLL